MNLNEGHSLPDGSGISHPGLLVLPPSSLPSLRHALPASPAIPHPSLPPDSSCFCHLHQMPETALRPLSLLEALESRQS